MRFGLYQEAGRYAEMAEEARFAEEMGFDFYAVPEQHFDSSVSAPETILPFVAARTSRINLRWASVPLFVFNHPIRVAERLTTLDVISKGRAQLGTASSADARTLHAFGIDPTDTRRQWQEALDVIRTVLTEQPFDFHGEIWDIPPTHLEPLPYQQPHPPLFVSASDLETHADAGRKGIGVITASDDWEFLEKAVSTYRRALAGHEVVKGTLTDSASALDVVREVGAPEPILERARKLAAMGYDEFILRIDGMGHERHMQAIELVGKRVIPELKPVSAQP
jgi:alkanesulfonate monooxygenase SsuD/methylene tetrahydromethanopterin reductase-like flavin-dependent oxidoreductase (luciferase family)